jgi:uncharacterized membrane protein (DUF2068 family)
MIGRLRGPPGYGPGVEAGAPERSSTHTPPPGTVKPRRFRPRLHWELLVCGARGHELVGADVRTIAPEDRLVVFEEEGVRWHRCLRCDSWLPLPPPANPTRDRLPAREEIELPLRGRPLRDRVVLRLIAIDRAFHFVLLGLLAIAIFLFASHQHELKKTFFRVVADLQNGVGGGPVQTSKTGILHDLDKLFTLKSSTLNLVGAGVVAYAVLEGVEAIGLWLQRRWAEYLTFIATTAFLPLEVFELTRTVSPLKITALIVNTAIVIYLLYAKRLFGIRGGARAEEALREHDVGWQALERVGPQAIAARGAPGAPGAPAARP